MVTFGRFSGEDREYAEAAIFQNDVPVGTIARCKDNVFVTESSRARKWAVVLYEVALDCDEDSREFMVTPNVSATEALKKARDYCRQRLA